MIFKLYRQLNWDINKFSALKTMVFCALTVFTLSDLSHAADEISYDFEVTGLEEGEYSNILQTFDEASLLVREASTTIISVSNLRNRLNTDLAVMAQILRAEGYYAGETSEQFLRNDNHFEIRLNVSPGPLYHYGEITINYQGSGPDENIQKSIYDAIIITPGAPARADPVLDTETNILNTLPKFGYPFAKDIQSNLVVDHQTQEMTINFAVKTGARRRMGTVKLEGLKTVDARFIKKFITWPNDSYYEQRFVDEFRARIIKSNLFSGVNIEIEPEDEDRASVTVNHIEAKHRTIGTSIGYSTAEGIGGEVSWQHRNFMGDGKRLKVTARASEIEQSLASLLELPHFKRLDQTLSFEGVFRRQDTDAFFAHVFETRAGIDRVMTDDLALLANVELEYSDVTDTLGDRDFFLVSFPVGVRWDSSDNLLDANRGIRASIITAPSYGIGDETFQFLKSEFRASAYFPLTAKENLIFALRTRLGSIIGAQNETLPATRRFYSGGGGSIRGYAFQHVGPLAFDSTPLGGRSVNEFAAEFRWKFENNLGFVAFAEAGNVYDSTTPKFNSLRYAAGIGARYATGFGPVRFDVAVPLNKRVGDSSFQIYISLGQAF